MKKSGLHALHDLDLIAIWLIAHGKMEHAKIMLTIDPETIVTHNRLVAGDLTNATIDTPLRITAMAVNLMEIAGRTTKQAEILLAVTTKLIPDPMNQASALLTIEITTTTIDTAILSNPIEATIVKEIRNILANPINAHNIMSENNIEDKISGNSIEKSPLPGTTTRPKGLFTVMIAM